MPGYDTEVFTQISKIESSAGHLNMRKKHIVDAVKEVEVNGLFASTKNSKINPAQQNSVLSL